MGSERNAMHQFLIILFASSAGLALFYLFVLVRPQKKPETASQKLFRHYAHRGYHNEKIPENSLGAFRRAAELGYGIELDLQLSSDGVVMVFHDYTMERMTEQSGKLSDYTAAELSTMRLRNRSGKLTDETIPTLSDVLDAVNGRVPLLVELKGENLDTSLCPAADAILQNYKGLYCVESFNPVLLRWYKKHRKEVLRGQLYTDVFHENKPLPHYYLLSLMVLNIMARPHFIACNRIYLKNFPVKLTTGLFGAERFTWTVRSEEEQVDGYMIFENIRPTEYSSK